MSPDGAMDEAALGWPMPHLRRGRRRTLALAGFMYLAYRQTEPDRVRRSQRPLALPHQRVRHDRPERRASTPRSAPTSRTSTRSCAPSYGGKLIDNTGYMIHVWTVPGYESSNGIFSDINPAITCPDGTYHHIHITELGHKDTTCLS